MDGIFGIEDSVRSPSLIGPPSFGPGAGTGIGAGTTALDLPASFAAGFFSSFAAVSQLAYRNDPNPRKIAAIMIGIAGRFLDFTGGSPATTITAGTQAATVQDHAATVLALGENVAANAKKASTPATFGWSVM